MKFTEAFKSLGYDVAVPRQDWSAENDSGICITLWAKEIDWPAKRISTQRDAKPNELWRSKPGNKKRIRHLERALHEFGGRVDVVLIHGDPGEGFGDASPWRPAERRGETWRVTAVDASTGHFEAEMVANG